MSKPTLEELYKESNDNAYRLAFCIIFAAAPIGLGIFLYNT
jgi:hypothetical protein